MAYAYAEDVLMDVSGDKDGSAPTSPSAVQTPGPPGLISLDSRVDPLAFLKNLLHEHGDVVRYNTRLGPCFVFAHPDHVQTILQNENYRRASLVKMMLGDGLLASDGPRWRSQRRIMQKDFLPDPVSAFSGIITHETAQMEKEWNTAHAAGEELDITIAMTRLTLKIIVKALFGDSLSEDHASELCSAVTQTVTDLGKISWTIFGAPVHFTPQSSGAFTRARNVIDTTCYEMISRRRAQPLSQRPADLLSLLLSAKTADAPMTGQQLRDEMVTMLVGGHETTALALSWAWKALAEHPNVETKFHLEIAQLPRALPLDLHHVTRLNLTRAIFQEAMRLYPPVWYMARVATEADVIDGHPIPRGACVLVSAWFTHRHADFWQSPDEFKPERFLDPATIPAHRFAYFPFGGGRHLCLGMHLAMLEGTMILAQLARSFRVLPVPGQHIQPAPGITLRKSPTLRARLQSRPLTQAEAQ